jgi:hypothetical protein
MSNSKKTREAEQRAQVAEQQTRQYQQQAEQVRTEAAKKAEEQIKITPEAQKVLTQSSADLDALRGGRLTDVPLIANFLSNQQAASETADRESPTGIFSLADAVANPNLISMQREKNKSLRARDTAAGVSALAAGAEEEAVNRIGSISGMDLGARSSLVNFLFQNAGLAQNNVSQSANLSNTAWERYQFEKQHRTFGQQLLGGAIAGGASVLGSYLGRPPGK